MNISKMKQLYIKIIHLKTSIFDDKNNYLLLKHKIFNK